jgi:glycosyltransferase involved in cell wall biosynthesis
MKNNIIQNENQNAKSVHHFFSVVVTTYNRANIVSRALNSLIAQTEPDWEAIIVDDESTDDTYYQISPFLKTYPEILYIRQPHRGEAAAKNAGLRSARGTFITFLDSDDEFHPFHLESRKKILVNNPTVKFLYGGAKILGNQYVPDRYNNSKLVNLNDCVIGGTFFIDRNIAISLNGFNDILIGTDADLYDRVLNSGINMMKIIQPTYIYHHETEDSITNKMLADS